MLLLLVGVVFAQTVDVRVTVRRGVESYITLLVPFSLAVFGIRKYLSTFTTLESFIKDVITFIIIVGFVVVCISLLA